MAYKMYMAGVLMPVTPSKVKVKINSQNETMNLINGGELNILKAPGLTDVSFDLILPHAAYPFANGGTQPPQYYLSLFKRLKTSKEPFQWILSRSLPNGQVLFHNDLTVGIEDYQITDDVKEGFDITVSIQLKQWRAYGTKTVILKSPAATGQMPEAAIQEPPRENTDAPANTTYTVKPGDCLWNIAKKYLGDGSRYMEIYELNKDKIKTPHLIYPDQVLTLPSRKG